MSDQRASLPDFANPPVIEVALAVQFKRIPGVRVAHMGLLWAFWKDGFSETEEHPPLEYAEERFEPGPGPAQGARIVISPAPFVPRCWFLNKSGTELIQVQPDRFVHNWRKVGEGDKYPRYEKIRDAFAGELRHFCEFLNREKIGEMIPTQCDVTYVNHIEWGSGAEVWSGVEKVTALWSGEHSDAFLPAPEDVRFAVRYVMPGQDTKPVGRLHVSLQPAYRTADKKPILVLTLTARGKPIGEGFDGVLAALNRGREWVVRGFAGVTTPQMHKAWRRLDAR
ncbi:MAG: TIGR04255 family protein [Planctomycetes bacterium]|nr:TIGR04255 family protein [Planctomycetota bacterium]